MNPWTLDYWKSGEYQAAREKLDYEEIADHQINPDRKNLFRALALTPENRVKIAIIGQDPYPRRRDATGVAFSIPVDVPSREHPPTLRAFLSEYSRDTGYTYPDSGNLESWCAKGVLLWNAIPSCREGVSLSHDWPGQEWEPLTREIISRLSARGIVFALLGSVARRYFPCIDLTMNEVILTSHPSPRGSQNSRTPFVGSRLFTTINDKLMAQGMDPIDWKLDGSVESEVPRTGLAGGRILPNITGADLGGLRQPLRPNTHIGNFEV